MPLIILNNSIIFSQYRLYLKQIYQVSAFNLNVVDQTHANRNVTSVQYCFWNEIHQQWPIGLLVRRVAPCVGSSDGPVVDIDASHRYRCRNFCSKRDTVPKKWWQRVLSYSVVTVCLVGLFRVTRSWVGSLKKNFGANWSSFYCAAGRMPFLSPGRGGGGLGPDLPSLTCGTCGNLADPATLSGWWGSRGHVDPLNFWTSRQKFMALPLSPSHQCQTIEGLVRRGFATNAAWENDVEYDVREYCGLVLIRPSQILVPARIFGVRFSQKTVLYLRRNI